MKIDYKSIILGITLALATNFGISHVESGTCTCSAYCYSELSGCLSMTGGTMARKTSPTIIDVIDCVVHEGLCYDGGYPGWTILAPPGPCGSIQINFGGCTFTM